MENKINKFGRGTLTRFDAFEEFEKRFAAKKRADKRDLENLSDEELTELV